MKTYKLGNKANCLIRAYTSGQIGSELIEYNNQPYTIIEDCQCNITFQPKQEAATAETLRLRDSRNFIKEITFSNCLLTTKIFNLIFSKIEGKLISNWEKCSSDDDKKIFLNTNKEEIYQVFIYKGGKLEQAYGSINPQEGIDVEYADSNYLVVYQYLEDDSETYSLNAMSNIYITLDIQLIGNEDDKTNNSLIHIEKASLNVDKNMRFNRGLNTVDLVFTVINDKNNSDNYIIL